MTDVKGHQFGSRDYMELFQPNAPWPSASHITNVFVLSSRYAAYGPEAELTSVIAGLKARGIRLAIGIGALSGGAKCGFHVEGYSAPGEPVTIAMRMRKLGADVAYFGMDEPLFFGHFFNGPNACHASIQALTQDVATKVQEIRKYYPDAKFGQSEPVTSYPGNDWLDAVKEWFTDYQSATGTSLDFFHLDLAWNLPWRDRVKLVKAVVKEHGASLGVIFNGDGDSLTDSAWLGAAISRYEAYKAAFDNPDQIIFSSWMVHPTHVLPETDPTSFTNIFLQYQQLRNQPPPQANVGTTR